jgi:hypothetical protein
MLSVGIAITIFKADPERKRAQLAACLRELASRIEANPGLDESFEPVVIQDEDKSVTIAFRKFEVIDGGKNEKPRA